MINKTHYIALLGITALTVNIHCAQTMEEDAFKAATELSQADLRNISGLFQVQKTELDQPFQAYSLKFAYPEEVYAESLFTSEDWLSIIVRTPCAFDTDDNIVQQFLTYYPELCKSKKLWNICFINPDSPQANAAWKQQEFFKYKFEHGNKSLFSASDDYLNVWNRLKFIQDKHGYLSYKATGKPFNNAERFVTLVQNRKLIYHVANHTDAAKKIVKTLQARD